MDILEGLSPDEQLEAQEIIRDSEVPRTLSELADIAGVSVTTLKRGRRVSRLGGSEMQARMIRGELTIPEAERELGIDTKNKYPKRFVLKGETTLGRARVFPDDYDELRYKDLLKAHILFGTPRPPEDWAERSWADDEKNDVYEAVKQILPIPVQTTMRIWVFGELDSWQKDGKVKTYPKYYVDAAYLVAWTADIWNIYMCENMSKRHHSLLDGMFKACLNCDDVQVQVYTEFTSAHSRGCGKLADMHPQWEKYVGEDFDYTKPRRLLIDVEPSTDSAQGEIDLQV